MDGASLKGGDSGLMADVREVLATCHLAYIDDGDFEWAKGLIASRRDAEHLPGCPKIPATCPRCTVDEAFAAADSTLAALAAAGFAVVQIA